MSNTKNVVLGMIAIFILLYISVIGMNFYMTQTNKLQLERVLPRGVEHALKAGMESGDSSSVKEILKEEIEDAITGADNVQIQIPAMDLEKGLLSVVVSLEYTLLTGEERTIREEKTMIIERQIKSEPRVTITFLVEEEVYKEYQVVRGQTCPLPVLPSRYFAGWIEYGSASNKLVSTIGNVWTDKIYVAVAK